MIIPFPQHGPLRFHLTQLQIKRYIGIQQIKVAVQLCLS
ncbi:Uncharacterised protein [Vibrio cholerae]|nr:Uncharacterised protein [Vibrio cholerae]